VQLRDGGDEQARFTGRKVLGREFQSATSAVIAGQGPLLRWTCDRGDNIEAE